MRVAAAVVIIAALGGLFWWQKNSGHQSQAVASPPAQQVAVSPAPTGAAAPREPSEHNWMKRSLDRARDVTNQARSRTRDSQDP